VASREEDQTEAGSGSGSAHFARDGGPRPTRGAPQIGYAADGLNALTVVPRAPNFSAFARVSANFERA
jgi:hypothetical protein